MKVSVHILAKETDGFGKLLFKSCIECLLLARYAHEIIIIDNGCREDIVSLADSLLKEAVADGVLHNYVIHKQLGTDDFSALRNKAMELMSPEANRLHWIDTDECYPEFTLNEIKNICEVKDPAAIRLNFFHHMISPSLYQEIYPKVNVYKIVPGLKWEFKVHEHLVGYNKEDIYETGLYYLHFGYVRPQWQQAIKWLKYDVWDRGHANGYREYRDDENSPTKDYYRDDRTPDQCLDDRIPHCKEFDFNKWTFSIPFADNVLDKWAKSGLEWKEWVNREVGPSSSIDGVVVPGSDFWREWQNKRVELGSWKSTIGWCCEELGFKEKI